MRSAKVIPVRVQVRSYEIGKGHTRTDEVTDGLLMSHEDGKGQRMSNEVT